MLVTQNPRNNSMLTESIEFLAERARRIPVIRNSAKLWNFLRPSYERVLRFINRGQGIELMMPTGLESFRFDLTLRNFDFVNAEEPVYRWLSDYLKPGMTFFDIGAFVGHYSLCAAKRIGAEGRVLAFEPSDANYASLIRHIQLNHFHDQIHPYDIVIGDKDEANATFFLYGEGIQASNGMAFGQDVEYIDRTQLRRVSKQMRSIDSLVGETGYLPDIIKIDVEGAEERVLRGAASTLRNNRIPVICSIHPFWLVGLNDSTESLLRFVRSVGYRVFDFDGLEKHKLGFEEVLILPE